MVLSSNWLQESNIFPLSYSISAKRYKDLRKMIQDRNVSKLLIGNNYQEQYDSWAKEIEWIAKLVEKKKKCKGRNMVYVLYVFFILALQCYILKEHTYCIKNL